MENEIIKSIETEMEWAVSKEARIKLNEIYNKDDAKIYEEGYISGLQQAIFFVKKLFEAAQNE